MNVPHEDDCNSRKKARLVAKGFSQVEVIDYNELCSPVVHFETVRLMFALASLESWYITSVTPSNITRI